MIPGRDIGGDLSELKYHIENPQESMGLFGSRYEYNNEDVLFTLEQKMTSIGKDISSGKVQKDVGHIGFILEELDKSYDGKLNHIERSRVKVLYGNTRNEIQVAKQKIGKLREDFNKLKLGVAANKLKKVIEKQCKSAPNESVNEGISIELDLNLCLEVSPEGRLFGVLEDTPENRSALMTEAVRLTAKEDFHDLGDGKFHLVVKNPFRELNQRIMRHVTAIETKGRENPFLKSIDYRVPEEDLPLVNARLQGAVLYSARTIEFGRGHEVKYVRDCIIINRFFSQENLDKFREENASKLISAEKIVSQFESEFNMGDPELLLLKTPKVEGDKEAYWDETSNNPIRDLNEQTIREFTWAYLLPFGFEVQSFRQEVVLTYRGFEEALNALKSFSEGVAGSNKQIYQTLYEKLNVVKDRMLASFEGEFGKILNSDLKGVVNMRTDRFNPDNDLFKKWLQRRGIMMGQQRGMAAFCTIATFNSMDNVARQKHGFPLVFGAESSGSRGVETEVGEKHAATIVNSVKQFHREVSEKGLAEKFNALRDKVNGNYTEDLDLKEFIIGVLGETEGERTKNYKKYALLCHPDKNPGDEIASCLFKIVNEVYQTSKALNMVKN